MRRNADVSLRLSKLRLPALWLAILLQLLPGTALQLWADSEATLEATASAAAASAAAASAAAASAGGAPAGALAELLKGGSVPLTIKATDLTPQWRQMTFGHRPLLPADALEPTERYLAQRAAWHYTRGETFSYGGETYLLAYRQPLEPPQESSRASAATRTQPELRMGAYQSMRLRPGTVLSLSLINLRTAGNINDIRAFDPARDIITPEEDERERAFMANTRSMSNLRQLGLALLMYAEDYDARLPPMRSANSMAQIKSEVRDSGSATVQQLLTPYVTTTEIFVHPATRAIYRPNSALSRRLLPDLKSPADVIAFYEARPASDGTRGVLFANGHVRRVKENSWAAVMAESQAGLAARGSGGRKPNPSPAQTNPGRRVIPPPPAAAQSTTKSPSTKPAAPAAWKPLVRGSGLRID